MNYKQEADKIISAASFDKFDLRDITALSIPDGDRQSKMVAFLEGVRNPYLFRVGDIGVHVVFSGKKGDSLQDHICHLLSARL